MTRIQSQATEAKESSRGDGVLCSKGLMFEQLGCTVKTPDTASSCLVSQLPVSYLTSCTPLHLSILKAASVPLKMFLCMHSSHSHSFMHTTTCAHYCLNFFFLSIIEWLYFGGYLCSGILYTNKKELLLYTTHGYIKTHIVFTCFFIVPLRNSRQFQYIVTPCFQKHNH